MGLHPRREQFHQPRRRFAPRCLHGPLAAVRIEQEDARQPRMLRQRAIESGQRAPHRIRRIPRPVDFGQQFALHQAKGFEKQGLAVGKGFVEIAGRQPGLGADRRHRRALASRPAQNLDRGTDKLLPPFAEPVLEAGAAIATLFLFLNRHLDSGVPFDYLIIKIVRLSDRGHR